MMPNRHWKRLKTPRGSSTNKALLLSRHWMKGVGQVLVGMNRRKEADVNWSTSYRDALKNLRRAKELLADVGDVDLLPLGAVRDEYVNYVEARILTISGWQARYRAEDSVNPVGFEESAEFFDRSAKDLSRYAP